MVLRNLHILAKITARLMVLQLPEMPSHCHTSCVKSYYLYSQLLCSYSYINAFHWSIYKCSYMLL